MLNKLDNFIKNTEGRILYVSPSDLDSTDSITNQGNSLAQPFKTLQRAIIEAARFSYLRGNSNDEVEKTTILLMPGQHTVDNRPGFVLEKVGVEARVTSPSGTQSAASTTLNLTLDSNFDLTQEDNILYKFNSIHGGVIVPRGTSIVGLDLRKTKIRPKYVPNPTDSNVSNSAIFRITGACYFWQFSIFDGSEQGTVYTDPTNFSVNNQSFPSFSHHKLTCFEYADGVNKYKTTGLTDLDMYYAKLSNAFNVGSGRDIDNKYPANPDGFAKQRPEWEIVGAFANDPIQISNIEAGSGGTASNQVTVTTAVPHELTGGTPIKISGVNPTDYNISTKVQSVSSSTVFTYLLPTFRINLPTPGNASSAFVTIDTDTVSGASPYVFNISLRSVWGMKGMLADGSKASGFRSMVVAQFTAVSLQKDDRAFVKYSKTNRNYNDNIAISRVAGATLSLNSSSTDAGKVYHSDPAAIYRSGWESSHIKATNDAFMQIVSVFAIGFNKHLDSETGGDMSITNSNSNFGQIALNSSGFKKEAFEKDNKAFITSIITPRAIVTEESNLDWQSLDVGITTTVGITSHLYLYGFNSKDVAPPILTQGYRVGARISDKLYFTASGTEYSANILMSDASTSSVKEYSVTSVSGTIFTIGSHTIQTGEKVIIISDDGDLPENIVENNVYYAIRHSGTEIKLASSQSSSTIGDAITVYAGTNLKILSRVSDKVSGDVGHPIQFDTTNNQWYITTNAGSLIYNKLMDSGVVGLGTATEPTYIKRIEDTRSLDEKVYKIRVVVPKELQNAKNPENSFIIQESSSTGFRNNDDPSRSTLVVADYDYNKNLSLIAKCTSTGNAPPYTVTIISELPHNLHTGDSVIIKNVTDSVNTSGEDNVGYNGTFVVTVTDDLTFTYTLSTTPGSASFANNTTSRTILSPRFERNNLQSNLYIYRKEVISSYISGVRDGIYHFYVLSSDKAILTEFTNIKYSQNVVDLYPQLDRDNINDNPASAKSFAKRSPLGEVVTNDLKKSITRESTDTLLTKLGVGLDISGVSNETTITPTITFSKRHGLSGIINSNGTFDTESDSNVGGSPSSGYIPGTYQNVKLLDSLGGNWKGATAKVVVVGGGSISSAEIVSSGSGYSVGAATTLSLFFDATAQGFNAGIGVTLGTGSNGRFNVNTSGITPAIDNVVQFTGAGTTSDTYHRITAVSSDTTISIGRTAGDPVITENHYAVVLGPSIFISGTSHLSGITTFNCFGAHGLFNGNKFRVIDSTNNNLGDYIVKEKVDFDTFTALTPNISAPSGHILKHGLSSNEASSDSSAENLGTRSVSFFDNETLTVVSFTSDTTIQVSSSLGSILKRFPLGSYIQIDEEIMRIASNTLSGGGSDVITVIRGALGTRQVSHDANSLIKKIKPIAVEFRRPSILRASGHTFEYLGYGPGNYSTALPQVQSITLTEREEFLVQSQERSGGIVVYTGMNNNGDSFVGNRKTSSATGEEITYDAPIPTITGEDPSRLSVVFDEVTIKERLMVEGGNSGTILSQFDGPVTFSKEVKFNGPVSVQSQKISDDTDSLSTTTGALVVPGGVGIGKRLNVGGALKVDGLSTFAGITTVTGETLFTKQLSVSGVSTFAGITTVTGDTLFTKQLSVSGVSTFAGITTVTGETLFTKQLSVSGVSTFAGITTVTGPTLFTKQLSVSGVSTFNGIIQVGAAITLYPSTGIVSATSFYGDGTNLTNTGSALSAASGSQRVVVTSQTTGTMTASATDSDLTFNSTTNTLSSLNISIGNDLGVTGNTTLTGNLAVTAPSTISGYGTIPIGGIIMWSGSTANIPTGWALCNDQTVNGIKTPDLRNRFVVGAHSGAGIGTVETAGPGFNADNGTLSSSYTPGNSGGETAHQLTTAELASHSHTFSPDPVVGRTGQFSATQGNQPLSAHDAVIGNTGGNKFHENRPPYYALAFIMRIL